ncbi:hypothetical protein MXB_2413, partial [Myxobolus squamalis]
MAGNCKKTGALSAPVADEIVSFIDSTFCYDDKNCNSSIKILKNVNLTIDSNNLIAICGLVGAGKSSFLKCIIGEIHNCSGKNPSLFKGSIRENILRGQEYDNRRYDKVIEVCCLKYDLEKFPQGDRKDVGVRGCNLSGGQKARVCLAATVYRKADIYLLDDIFSALDIHVAD